MKSMKGGGAYGLSEDCACLVIEIIICNHLPAASQSRGCSAQVGGGWGWGVIQRSEGTKKGEKIKWLKL